MAAGSETRRTAPLRLTKSSGYPPLMVWKSQSWSLSYTVGCFVLKSQDAQESAPEGVENL